ncbi:Armadillo Repeat-Containing X-Linked Protein 4 [Manis pentadactyla]|nr:Armadillo Repeat-Containing X-Linked Protein 4 [Manis pentadactyla]
MPSHCPFSPNQMCAVRRAGRTPTRGPEQARSAQRPGRRKPYKIHIQRNPRRSHEISHVSCGPSLEKHIALDGALPALRSSARARPRSKLRTTAEASQKEHTRPSAEPAPPGPPQLSHRLSGLGRRLHFFGNDDCWLARP